MHALSWQPCMSRGVRVCMAQNQQLLHLHQRIQLHAAALIQVPAARAKGTRQPCVSRDPRASIALSIHTGHPVQQPAVLPSRTAMPPAAQTSQPALYLQLACESSISLPSFSIFFSTPAPLLHTSLRQGGSQDSWGQA